MKTILTPTLVLLGLGLLLGGCASFDASIERGRSLQGVQRFFVLSNLNDNRAIDQQIATALRARGRTAEVGPQTMLPDDAQAVVSFQDHWSWDFGEHLNYLRLTASDPRASQPYAAVTFSAKVPLREKTAVTVSRLVDALLEK
jgi:hypothetical protein